jgi:hypothetical protein
MNEKSESSSTMKITGYIITQGGLPCTLYNAAARHDTKRGGVLVPGTPIAEFTKPRDAKRAIGRTQRVAEQLEGSLVGDWLKLTPLLSGQPYEVVPLAKQS